MSTGAKPTLVATLLPAQEPLLRASGADTDRARVLVVDDDERNLLAIRTVLEDLADIVVVRSGEEALRQILRDEFAVILLDVYMPGMDGYEVAQIVRGRDQSKRIPIVFLSAVNKETEHLMRGYSMGAVDYVFKPVEPVVLRSKVAVFVDLFRMRREIQHKAREQEQLLEENLRTTADLIRTEQELRLAEQRQAAIINALPIALYVRSAADGFRTRQIVGGNFLALTGIDAPAGPSDWIARIHPEDVDAARAGLTVPAAGGNSLSVEYRWCGADDEYRHLLDQSVIARDKAGRPTEIVGTLLDVTDRKALENQLLQAHKMDAIGKLTGGIAHDFNNLLAAVLGGIGLIERKLDLPDEQTRILAMTRHAAEQGTELVRRLLAFARRQKLQPAPIRLADMSSRLNELLGHTLGGLVEIRWTGMAEGWSTFADETQLELALMNLAINARDAMPEGGTVTFAASNRSIAADTALDLAPGDYVALSVSDTGEGIAPKVLAQVMEPFFTTKPVGKGTGLGLSMVYGFARQSGGAVEIASQVDEGTTVTLWLPRAPAELEAAAVASVAPTERERGAAMRILLVDDHDGVRAMTAAMLAELGHDVEAVSDGPSFHRAIGAGRSWDLLITDYAMPTVSGSELLRQAREIAPGLPGLIITGYADPDSIGNRPDDVEVLTKPFTLDQLQDAIGRVRG